MTTESRTPILVDDIYPSRFLHGADIPGDGWLVTISDVAVEELKDFQGQAKDKIVLSLVELDKQIAMNKTQGRTLQDFFGPDASLWIGQQVVIAPEKLKNGQMTIRFSRGRPQTPAQPRAAPAPMPPEPEQPPADDSLAPPPPEEGENESPM